MKFSLMLFELRLLVNKRSSSGHNRASRHVRGQFSPIQPGLSQAKQVRPWGNTSNVNVGSENDKVIL